MSKTLAVGLALYEVLQVSGVFSRLQVFIPTPIHLSISLCVILLLVYIRPGRSGWPYVALRLLLMMCGLCGAGFILFDYQKVLDYGSLGYVDTLGEVMAILLSLSILEATRRSLGMVLPVIILVILLLTYFQNDLPGALHGQGNPLDAIAYDVYVGTSGIFGVPFETTVDVLLAFLLFGALYQASGAAKWFMDLANALTGWSVGGPAKACVVASALMGTITGSVGGNAATVGNFTIPLMKKIGYSPAFAGGVEATSSTGGAILPPVMGAVAFVMAQMLGKPYMEIAKAAAIPAVLYYLTTLSSVHFRAKKLGLRSLDPTERLPLGPTLRQGWYHLVPVLALLYFLFIQQVDAQIAALYSIPFIIVCSYFNKDRSQWLTLRPILQGVYEGVKNWLSIGVITAAVGILVGALVLSGMCNA
ncbi:MAG: TRAP transporter fused permease subunit, partial [Alicyclobacillus sp.]|nr:TRAP transporter fused permease subunit [Alicyclobacillus sp.]